MRNFTVVIAKWCPGDVMEDGMRGTCGTYRGEERCVLGFSGR